jgi:hypothetical protein
MNVSNSVFYRILRNRSVVWIEFLRTQLSGNGPQGAFPVALCSVLAASAPERPTPQ